MSKSEFTEVINASKEKVWEVLFYQYGDIHVHNPGMIASHYMNNGTKGELNSKRHVNFSEKLWLDETITEVEEFKRVKIVADDHNLPMMRDMSATYELKAIGNDKTELKMTSVATSSPGFMMYLMKGQLAKGLVQHLFGMKYYIETGKTLSKEKFSEVYKNYRK
ncbi:MAG: hypothetical protein HEP71_24765 [Roseivirga sp.]|nr:hypothetical protein [Roseivirga sp.]